MTMYCAGGDVHKSTTSFEVLNANGAFHSKTTIATTREAILAFIGTLDGQVRISIEEGQQAHWFYRTFKDHVSEIIITDPRENSNGSKGDKSDELDAKLQAEELFFGRYRPIFHDFGRLEVLRELMKSYETMTADITRTMNRIKSLYSCHGIACGGSRIYSRKNRPEWLGKIQGKGSKSRAEILFTQLEALQDLKKTCRTRMVKEARRHKSFRILQTIPGFGPIRSSQVMATLITPSRFPSKYFLFKYCGYKVISRGSGETKVSANGEIVKIKNKNKTYGLNRRCNKTMKKVFKGAANTAAARPEFAAYEADYIASGCDSDLARVRSTRKVISIVYTLWKRGENYDPVKAFPEQGEIDE